MFRPPGDACWTGWVKEDLPPECSQISQSQSNIPEIGWSLHSWVLDRNPEDRQADTCSSLASVLTLNGGLTSPGIPPLERILRTPISPSCQGGNLQEVTQIGRELVKF